MIKNLELSLKNLLEKKLKNKNSLKSNWPNYDKSELKIATSIIKSGKVNYWTGAYGKLFEKKYSLFHKIKYCVSVNSGTSALECAIKALNLKKNSEIITTPRSYYTSASSIILCGHKPKFSDISIKTQNLDPEILKKNISKKTKAIICVHLAGLPCQMKEIMKIAKDNNIFVIEDCSQAHGASIKGKKVGSFGDISIWSFCQDKIISTGGEGGMIGTNNINFFNELLSLRDNGRNYNKLKKVNASGSFNYLHDFIGSNYRMTEIQAGLGISQLKKLNSMIYKRNNNAKILDDNLKNFESIILINTPKDFINSYYRYYFFVKEMKNKKILMDNIRLRGIECFEGSCPEIYLEAFFKKKYKFKRLKNAKYLGERSLCLKIDQTISKQSISQIAKILKQEINKIEKI